MTAALVELCRWADRHEHARELPDHLLFPAEREHHAQCFAPIDNTHAGVVEDIGREVSVKGIAYRMRRGIERRTADYLERHCLYPKLVDRLRACRISGAYGYRDAGDGSVTHEVAWDSKCCLTRLCPDEAREEQMRLAERYVPAIDEWRRVRSKPIRQVQYAVLTWPNVAAGELAQKKRDMAKHVAAWLKSDRCLAIKGALVVQEDPLGADLESWNLHCNLVLLVQGRFHWSEARQEWYRRTRALFDDKHRDFQCHFKDITGADLWKAARELIKYSVKHVTEKQLNQKGAPAHGDSATDGTTCTPAGERHGAPGLTEWPIERFIEWWEAGKGFRRTRSYGALFKVSAPPKRSLDGVTWVGRINYNEATGEYETRAFSKGEAASINLIPGHNSADRRSESDKSVSATGPPMSPPASGGRIE
jgi:hypothetical protein